MLKSLEKKIGVSDTLQHIFRPSSPSQLVPKPVGSGEYQSQVLGDIPLVYLSLDDLAGTTAVDLSGNGFDGTYVNGPTLAVAPLITTGKSITLASASSQVVTLPAIADGANSVRTIECWVKTTQSGVGNPCIIASDDTSGTRRFILDLSPSSNAKTEFVLLNGAAIQVATGLIQINDGVKHHIVCTYDGVKMLVYVDGVQDGAGTTTAIGEPTGTINALAIGAVTRGGVRSSFFNGTVDEVALYNSALSASRVAAHYAAA